MLLLASGTALIDRFGCQSWFGQLIDPRGRHRVVLPRWAADNAAYSGFDADAYMRMINRISDAPTRPIFVAVPDVVADAAETSRLWRQWTSRLRPFALPLAYVLQDGVTTDDVPWDECAAVFIGGSTAFKVGAQARVLVEIAKTRGTWIHMGRVNTVRRLMYAQQIGCDSVDGSGFAKFPNEMIPYFTRVNSNGLLFQ